MILVDTSVWIDHLHSPEPRLSQLLEAGDVCTHAMVVGELALGSLRRREEFLSLLTHLPCLSPATHGEVLVFTQRQVLFGIGLSLVDAHLLAAIRLSPTTRLWTRDRRLREAAERLAVPTESQSDAG